MASTTAAQEAFLSVGALQAHQEQMYSHLAALTFCVYDIILSSGQEIECIWRSKLSSVKVLYFIIRYFIVVHLITLIVVTTLANLSAETCQRYWLWSLSTAAPITIVTLNAILLIRVSALYGHSKRVFVILLILALGGGVVSPISTHP